MWLSLAWNYIVSFIDTKLNEKNYKAVIILLIALFLAYNINTNRKVSFLADKLDSITAQFTKQDSTLEKGIYSHMGQMNSDAIELFQGYANTNTEDLKTIIDKTSVTSDNSFLLKKLIEKSNSEILQEIKKVQFRSRYLPPDSMKIDVRKVSLIDSINQPYYARY